MSSSHLFLGLPIALWVLYLELSSGFHSAARTLVEQPHELHPDWGASAVGSSNLRSPVPLNMAVPPDDTTLAYKFLRIVNVTLRLDVIDSVVASNVH